MVHGSGVQNVDLPNTSEMKNKFRIISTVISKDIKSSIIFDDQEIANLALLEINCNSNSIHYSIDSFSRVSDLNGNNFLYVNYNPFGYSVIDLATYATIELNPFTSNKQKVSSDEFYYPVIGIVKEAQGGKEEYIDCRGKKYEKEVF